MSEATEQAEKRQKTTAVQKEAKNSQKSQSDAKKDIDPVGDVKPGDNEKQTKDAEEKSKKVAEGKGVKKEKTEKDEPDSYKVPADYDPGTDPVVPSSAVAQVVSTELKSIGESPTLAALHKGREGNAYDKKAHNLK